MQASFRGITAMPVPGPTASADTRVRGFTLVELMVTVAVVGILAAVAAPSFSAVMHRNRLVTAANEFVAALQNARMEAVRRNRRVTLCPSTNGAGCAGSDWSRFIVFVDGNANGEFDAASDAVVNIVEPVKSGAGITATALSNRAWFRSDGRLSVGASERATFKLVSDKLPSSENGRLVEVAVSRVSVCTIAGSATACP